MTKGNSVLRLLEGFPVSLHDSLDAGRIIVASKALEEGELVLAARPTAVTIYKPHWDRWCLECTGWSPKPLRLSCPASCGAHFCSKACEKAAQEAVHTAEVCAARRSANDEAESFSSRENGGSIDAELSTLQHSEMHLLLDMLARRAYRYSLLTAIDHCRRGGKKQRAASRRSPKHSLSTPLSPSSLSSPQTTSHALGPATTSISPRAVLDFSKLAAADTLDDVSIIAPSVASAPCGLTALALDKATSAEATDSSSSTSACEGLAGSSVPLPTFDEGLALWKPSPELLREFGHHEHNTSKESRMMEAATAVVRLAPSVLLEGLGQDRLAETLEDALAREECNSFGLYQPPQCGDDACLAGFGVYPGAAMFNHSCVPNLFRVHHRFPGGGLQVFRTLRRVAVGEELVIRYEDIYGGFKESGRRQTDHLAHWCFHCRCPRCTVLDSAGHLHAPLPQDQEQSSPRVLDVRTFEASCLCPARHVWPQQPDRQKIDEDRGKRSSRSRQRPKGSVTS
ncbi:hypothetical protein CYMTET_49040 [Cymbomonas tetramitiformis]|uniref:SET domain-containing protein n=1 Tax=Cymbomonas tetramitiformis TaxID=36881 RepID=A0AAE0BSY2_9CHLO|nr:hypothetical protein CYMTET_49040 [Cymbomonas tetramitiformis]